MQLFFYLIKLSYVLSLLYTFSPLVAIPLICLSYFLFHHVLIPKLFPYDPLTLVDTFMSYESPKNRCHWGAITFYDKIEYSKLREIRVNLVKRFPKLHQKVINFFGCSYFKDIPLEQAVGAIEKVDGLHTKRDLELFCDKVFHAPFPKDGPLWKIYISDDYSDSQSVQISILHHCLYDGIGGVFLTWLYGPEDIGMLPPFKPTTLKEKILNNLGLLYSVPLATLSMALKKQELNPINNGKPMSGIKKLAYYDDIPFDKIKENYKKAGCTMNDYFMGVLSKSLKEYFKLKDPNGVYHNINIGFPINLRDQNPTKHSEVLLENKITAADITIPLIDDPIQESKKISRIINKLKGTGEFFANAFFLQFGVFMMPRFLMCIVNRFITSKTTLCFSNCPFVRKQLVLQNTTCNLQNEVGFLNNNAGIGVAVCIMTYVKTMTMSVVGDTARLPEPDELASIFRKNLLSG